MFLFSTPASHSPLVLFGHSALPPPGRRGGVGWSDRRERIDQTDERARERAEGGGGRGYDTNTLSIYIPFRPGAEEWWEGGAELREGLECLDHEEKEYMAQNMRVNYIKTPTLGGLMKKRNGDRRNKKKERSPRKVSRRRRTGL